MFKVSEWGRASRRGRIDHGHMSQQRGNDVTNKGAASTVRDDTTCADLERACCIISVPGYTALVSLFCEMLFCGKAVKQYLCHITQSGKLASSLGMPSSMNEKVEEMQY
jgi:hypothetical protein